MKIAIFILLFFCSICNGQNKQIDPVGWTSHGVDSLLDVLKAAKEDTNKVNTLKALGDKFLQTGAYEKAKNYANDALQLSEKINYKKGKAGAYGIFGIICIYRGNYNDAMKDYLIKLKTSEEIGDKSGIADGYFGMGRVYYFQGNPPEAYKNYFAALKIYEETGNKHGIGMCYIATRNSGTYPDAMKQLYAALNIFKETDDKRGLIDCYINIGAHYAVLGNNIEAMKNYSASLKIAEETGDKRSIAWNYSAIAGIYSNQDNYPEMLKFSFKALKIWEEIGDKQGILNSYNRLGSASTQARKFSEANKYLHDALLLSMEIGDNPKTMSIYKDLTALDTAMSNYKQALADFRLYNDYKSKMLDETGMKQIKEMKAKYESVKNEKQIALLTKDNEIQNITIKKQKQLMYSLIGSLTLIILLLLFGYRVYRSRQMLRLQDIRNKIAGDLHDDIGSTLNSISVYSEVARKNDAQRDESLEMIGDSSRKIIDVMSDIVWTINPENDSFAKIIFRMKSLAHNLLRAKNIEYTFHADEALVEKKLSLEDRRNLYLIFKEAINNLVKYSNATRVTITLSDENDHMKLFIRDNGIGFDRSEVTASNGLASMKRRADEMKAKFKIESQKGNGTQIELILAA